MERNESFFYLIFHWIKNNRNIDECRRSDQPFLSDNNEGNDENDDAIKRINDQSKRRKNMILIFWME